MTINTTLWDLAEHLQSDEDIQLCLEVCIEEAGDDPVFIVHALCVIARANNISQLAIEEQYKPFSVGGSSTFTTISRVESALGLQLTVQMEH